MHVPAPGRPHRPAGALRAVPAEDPRSTPSFAVATLLDWYRDHADGPALLPSLSTYLGHANPRDTYWYLSAAPELLALAADRLDAQQEGTRG